MGFAICGVGPKGRETYRQSEPAQAFKKAQELSGRGYANVSIADPHGQHYEPERFERVFVRPPTKHMVA